MAAGTVVTLSAAPLAREAPRGWDYLNQVAVFDADAPLADCHAARLASIERVTTEWFCWVDDDDPVPPHMPLPSAGVGVLYGVEHIHVRGECVDTREPQPWGAQAHLLSPFLIHKAICHTESARRLARQLPRGEQLTEWLLYYLLARDVGWQIDRAFEPAWELTTVRLRHQARRAIANSSLWLLRQRR